MSIFRVNLDERPVSAGWDPEPVYILVFVQTCALRKYV